MEAFAAWVVRFAILAIIILAIRVTVVGHQYADGKPSPKWQQRLLLTVSILTIGIVSIPLLSMSWRLPVGVAIWLGLNVATVPNQVSWWHAIRYTGQLILTAILMIVIIGFIPA
jgi:hypothetical protein